MIVYQCINHAKTSFQNKNSYIIDYTIHNENDTYTTITWDRQLIILNRLINYIWIYILV